MTINVANSLIEGMKECNVEILKVTNEVSLKKRYGTDWDRDIIVDILLETPKGDIVIEINHTNKKDWDELSEYYNTIDVFKIYEVTVDRNVNDSLKWFGVKEKEEAEMIRKEMQEEEKRKIIELREEKREYVRKMLESGDCERFNVYVSQHNPLLGSKDVNSLKCLKENTKGDLETVFLKFYERNLKKKFTEIQETFNIQKGIRQYDIIAKKESLGGGDGYNVMCILNTVDIDYNVDVYSQLSILQKGC